MRERPPATRIDDGSNYRVPRRSVIWMGALVRLKQYLTSVDRNPDAQYVCLGCETRFEAQPQVCPECGGYDIRRAEWTSPQSGESRPPDDSA